MSYPKGTRIAWTRRSGIERRTGVIIEPYEMDGRPGYDVRLDNTSLPEHPLWLPAEDIELEGAAPPDPEARNSALLATREHIDKVWLALRLVVTELLLRGELHDRSKLEDPEAAMFAEFTPKLKGMTYGSDEYKECLKQMGPALQHHYENNRHHPEFFSFGIADMNLIDVVEMFCDWWASSQRHADGDIMRSIDVNEKRFKMDPQLVAIFRNTAKLARDTGWGK